MKNFNTKELKATLTINGVEVEVVKLAERVPVPPLVPVGSDLYQDLCDIGHKVCKCGLLETRIKAVFDEIVVIPVKLLETDNPYSKLDMMNSVIEIIMATMGHYLHPKDEIHEKIPVPFVQLDVDTKYITALFQYAQMVVCSELTMSRYSRTSSGLTELRAAIISKETSKYNNGDFPYNVTP